MSLRLLVWLVSFAAGESKDAMDYELMKDGALPVKHQYVNIKKPGK